MKFTASLLDQLAAKNLLNHSLYQMWNEGKVPVDSLRFYARQYFHHVSAFPRYLSATHSNCSSLSARQVLLENLIEEEKGLGNHIELWLRFVEGLGDTREAAEAEKDKLLPETQSLVNTFFKSAQSSYAEGLGALFAYEHQVPEISKFKIQALKEHYDIKDRRTLLFFEVHQQADVLHTQALTELMEDLTEDEKVLAQSSASVASHRLWEFLDGIQRSMPAQ